MTRAALLLASAALVACAPSPDDGDARVTRPTLLAVRLDPPESAPGDRVSVSALVGSASGAVDGAPVEWALCDAPTSPAENRVVSELCVEAPGIPAGEGTETTFTVPGDACALFGSETPPGDFRPRDPDATGGFYLPLRATLDGARSVALSRLTCGLRSVPIDVASELSRRYTPNVNPTITGLDAAVDGRPVSLDAVPPGSVVTLTARASPGDLERYARVDPTTGTVTTASETLVGSFHATTGALDTPRAAAVLDADGVPRFTAVWHAEGPGASFLFVVVRDSRGGSDFGTFPVVTLGGGT